MLAIRLPAEIEQRLDTLARRTSRSKSHYVRAAILQHLGDLEDLHVAEARVGGTNAASTGAVPLAELKERYGALPSQAGLRTAEKAVIRLSAVFMPALEGGLMGLNPETGTTARGDSIEEALANLREATERCLEDVPASEIGHAVITSFSVACRP